MKRLVLLLLLGSSACGLIPHLPVGLPLPAAARPTATALALATITPTPQPAVTIPAPKLGDARDPLILSLAPAPRLDPSALNTAKLLVAHLEKTTGYTFNIIAPTSEADLVDRLAKGDAHIAVLSPFGYLLASNSGSVTAAFARQQNGRAFYGAQFIARSDGGFLPYFDSVKNADTADAATALAQFQNKKPCWSDTASPSGYVVPLGFLNQAGVQTDDPAFVAGQPTVVRAVYARGICDFGATYIDARAYPGLEDAYPDVMQKVIVAWRIPDIIPYETLVFASGLDPQMSRLLTRAFVDALDTPDGSAALQTLYGISAMQVSQDSQYQDFRAAVKASGLDLSSLVK